MCADRRTIDFNAQSTMTAIVSRNGGVGGWGSGGGEESEEPQRHEQLQSAESHRYTTDQIE